MVLWIVGITAVMVGVFMLVRYASLARGGRRRDEGILLTFAPLIAGLEGGQEPTTEELRELGAAPQVRPLMHSILEEHGCAQLLPPEFRETPEVARALLAHWMMHPNELQEAAVELEPERVLQRRIEGRPADFHVLRFRMREGHWAGQDWLLGVVGPFFEDDEAFKGPAGAFSRAGDKAGSTDPVELLDWFVKLGTSKS
jgi:hypothetical protein